MTKQLTTFFAILVLVFLSVTGCGDAPKAKEQPPAPVGPHLTKLDGTTVPFAELDETIPALLKEAEIPGLSIAVIDGADIVYSRVFGVKSLETNEPVEKDTLFEAASLTKCVLAYTALKLVDEGLLELDKPLHNYLQYKDIKHDERYKLITARIVLKHATGFPNWRGRDGKLKINFTPGEKYSYSGEGFVFLQRVIEKITGKDLSEVMMEKVFTPLKMTRSTMILKDLNRSAVGHDADMKAAKKYAYLGSNGAASLHATADDFARFLVAVANGAGLSEKMFTDMLTPQIQTPDGDGALSWGLGIGLDKTADDLFFWHWGDNMVFKAYTVVSTAHKKGIIYFANSVNGLSIVRKLTDMTLGGTYSIYKMVDYPLYDGPLPIIRKIIMSEGLEAGLKKYHEWKGSEPERFNEAILNNLGYYLMGKKKMTEAIEIFKLNVAAYPKSFNVYDSLGEAYMKNGDKDLAIKNYEKSVELNPDNTGGVEALKKLRQK